MNDKRSRCEAATHSGTRCKRYAQHNERFCYQHLSSKVKAQSESGNVRPSDTSTSGRLNRDGPMGFISYGVFMVIMTVLCLPVILIVQALMYGLTVLFRDTNVSFFGHIGSMAWRVPVYGILAGLTFFSFGLLHSFLLGIADSFSSINRSYLKEIHPDEVSVLRSELPKKFGDGVGGIWGFFGIGGLVLFWFDIIDHFWLLFLTTAFAVATVYGLIIYNHRQLY